MFPTRGGLTHPGRGRKRDETLSHFGYEPPTIGRLPRICVVVGAGVEAVALVELPSGLRTPAALILAALTFVALLALAAWSARGHRVLPPIPTPRGEAGPEAANDPSPELFLAARLAREGVDAQRIADHCAIPRALADFVVEQAGRPLESL